LREAPADATSILTSQRQERPIMHLQFVGCGDAFGSGGRSNTCFHLVGERTNVLIDCGASSLPALRALGIDRNAIDTILITHFHADHFCGLPFFVLEAQFGGRAAPLTIAGPPGLADRYTQAMETAFEHSTKVERKFSVSLQPLEERKTVRLGALEVTPYPVVHGNSGGPFFAYRISVEGRTICYSGDTEWTDTLVDAASGADLFIVECYVYDRLVRNHLSYRTIADNLARIGAKRVVLTHMSEDMLAHRNDVPQLCASDGMVVEL
jgi:ribonuclease BN (tRNA processing enzyme)